MAGGNQGRNMGEHEMAQHMANSFECAIEMTSHMKCKSMCVSTAFCSHDSKYKCWHYIYSAIEKAAQKHFKGECSTMFCQMMFECVMLNREEIRDQKQMSWPVSAMAECCPLSMCNMSCCCIERMCQMMKMADGSAASKRHQKYHLTGKHMMTPQNMVEMMSQSLNMDVKFNQMMPEEWKNMMMSHLSALEICCLLELFEMMERGELKKCTGDCEKLLGKAPMGFDMWMREHDKEFRM
jgi:hypothetical protein